ncbi:MAG: 4Fe-4S binding protein [Anaerolineaceae bacterium]|nr:4Fe-4S binding protein [Anaerolineaceae bacterium]
MKDLEAFLLQSGASSIGYTLVPQKWIFRDKAILYTNAIMMSMEMDKPRIDTAPSNPALMAVLEIYRDLGKIANRAADYLRKRGFAAHAGHPLNGLTLYPPLSQMAGLGWLGGNGLIITPEHGPRVRLAAIFTSIQNLPFNTENEHSWVAEFCKKCQLCVNKCPTEAIMEDPIVSEHGQISYVINKRCFPYFSDFFGCSVCIKVCPFSTTDYTIIEDRFQSSVKK